VCKGRKEGSISERRGEGVNLAPLFPLFPQRGSGFFAREERERREERGERREREREREGERETNRRIFVN
jgi:hypothetical protein